MARPNIIFILVDDLGWRDLSCYGSTFYETPNIDALVHEGIRFTDAYATCPVCSPTRASIMTGKYPATIGITNYIDWSGRVHPERGRLVDVPYFRELPLAEISLGRVLSDRNYATWHVGKWHLGGPSCYPDRHGFSVNIGGCEWGLPPNGYFSPWKIPTLPETESAGVYLTDHLTDQALRLIRENSRTDGPFFLNLWYHCVHTPLQAKHETTQKYLSKRQEMGLADTREFVEGGFFPGERKRGRRIVRRLIQANPVYAAMVETLDWNIGRIVREVRDLGIEDNTLLVFTSDNGGLATSEGSSTCNAPLSEGKGWMYEGGTRVPLIIKWPERARGGVTTDVPVASTDFYPTILEALGLPLLPKQHTDGESFLPLLTGDRYTRNRPLFWHYPHYGNQGGTPGASVRDHEWKLIRFFEDGHEELYNLREDVGETDDLSAAAPAKRRELSEILTNWQHGIQALIPARNPDYTPWAGREPCGHFGDR